MRSGLAAPSVAHVTQILVIDDDLATGSLIREVLSEEGYIILLAEHPDSAPAGTAPDLVITDLVGLNRYDSGLARSLVRRLQEHYPSTPIVVCTGYEEALDDVGRLDAVTVLPKPFSIEGLIQTVTRLAIRPRDDISE